MSISLKQENMENENDYMGLLVLIAGPSGVGKGTVIAELKKDYPQFVYPISCTTREMRPGEKEGEVYHFENKENFLRGIESGEFLEYACVHETNYYGTLKKPIIEALKEGKVVVREVDVQGFHSIKEHIPKKNLLTIFIKAKSEQDLIERIIRRSKLSAEEIERRMESARKEMADIDAFDFQVWSLDGQVRQCVNNVEEIIVKRIDESGLKIA